MTRIFFNQNIISPYRLPLFEELNEEYDVEVWFHRKGEEREWEAEFDDYGFDYKILDNFQLGPLTFNPGFFWKLLNENFDVYFINENPSTFLQSFAILTVAKLKQRPVVIWSETIDTEKSREIPDSVLKKIPVKAWRSFKESYRKILFKFSDRFVAFSEMAEEFLVRRGVAEEKIETQIQVMPEKLLPEPENHDLKENYSGQKMILSLGYLEERKGVQDLIEAFRRIDDEDYTLVIAGTGPYEKQLKKKASEDDRIEFVGYLSEQEKANYFDAADLFVLPTHHDPWGLVINEALHYSTPAITTEAAGAKELLDKEKIFREGDASELQNLLKKNPETSEKYISLDKGTSALEKAIEEFR
ncbi:glycosyltransferase family 4 protein [Candidatus Nanosalina sp. VS9-1]|uniref:glycosyltransferase family 4 protein n=1 Tax=Candidatus Nanosalina sp. VS9-1 TaxID=3388566 RepID=UPI0039DF6F3C